MFDFVVKLVAAFGLLALGMAAFIASINSAADWIQSLWRLREFDLQSQINRLSGRINKLDPDQE